jgi:hypothetical protein
MTPQILSYVLSANSLISLWLVGNKNKAGFILGIVNQVLWVWYALMLKQYGLLIGVIVYINKILRMEVQDEFAN